MFNFGIFSKKETNLASMSPDERSADYENAISEGNHKRIEEHEEFIESVMKGMGF